MKLKDKEEFAYKDLDIGQFFYDSDFKHYIKCDYEVW